MNVKDEKQNQFVVDVSAVEEWWRYVDHFETHLGKDARTTIIEQHRQHVKTTSPIAAENGGIFLTDIPDFDLTMMEIRFGKVGSLGLYSQKEASEREALVLEILNAASAAHL